MSNVISFQEAKARREQAKIVAMPTPVPDTKGQPQKMTVMKSLALSGSKESLFVREARRFRFIRMATPPTFIVMNTKILPPAFPPDDPPPLVA
jgi:hypothetical protein